MPRKVIVTFETDSPALAKMLTWTLDPEMKSFILWDPQFSGSPIVSIPLSEFLDLADYWKETVQKAAADLPADVSLPAPMPVSP